MKVYVLMVSKKTNGKRLEYVYRVYAKEQDAIDECRSLAYNATNSPDDIVDSLGSEAYHRIMVIKPEGFVCYSYDEEEVWE